MRNEDYRPTILPLPSLYHFENLVLDYHIESCGRLVGDKHLRIEQERESNSRSLPHPSGKLVGIRTHPVCRDSNLNQSPFGSTARYALGGA